MDNTGLDKELAIDQAASENPMKYGVYAYRMWWNYWARQERTKEVLATVQAAIEQKGATSVHIDNTELARNKELLSWLRDEGFTVQGGPTRSLPTYVTISWRGKGAG